ncbi:MAG: hypothetical protein R6U20_13450 [Longimonas sp.]|uniref:hypothetical protein n=1 Tax=Longimonas sp. TaxID=2039626 RepID=UPI003976C8E0
MKIIAFYLDMGRSLHGWVLCLLGIGLMVSLVGIALGPASYAQSANGSSGDDADAGTTYFHRAAQHYLANDMAEARATVEAGLEVNPDHAKLQALREQIESLPPDPNEAEGGTEGNSSNEGDGESGEAPGNEDPESESDAPDDPSADAPNEADTPPDDPPSDTDSGDADAGDAGAGSAEPSTPAPNPSDSSDASTSNEMPPHADGTPMDAQDLPESSASPSESPLPESSLTREQAEQLLQLVAAQDQPLMHAMQTFETARTSGRDW